MRELPPRYSAADTTKEYVRRELAVRTSCYAEIDCETAAFCKLEKVWGAFDMRLIVAALIALFASADAEGHILSIQPGGPYTATPGAN